MKINAVKQGYYLIKEGDTILEQRASEVEAIEALINFQLEGKEVTMHPPTYRVDLDNVSASEEIIYAEGYVHLTGDYGQYVRLKPSMDIIRISGEPAPKWQRKFVIKRTNSEDTVDTYTLYGPQPFQLHNSHEVVDYDKGSVRFWANEPWAVQYYVNDVLDERASDPLDLPLDQFNSWEEEEDMNRHTRTVDATYGDKVRVVARNGYGETDEFHLRIDTLHSLDQSRRIKELHAQITAIMKEPEPTE